VLDELFPGFVHPSRRGNANLRHLVHDMGADVGAEAFIRQQTAVIGRPDSRPTLAAIECATLVLSGDEDNTISNSRSVEMAEGIRGAKLVIVPHCGHLSPSEQPQAATKALAEWLQS
jgi:pimeloyl-ACP methyl ester carboxylesterase